MDEITNVILQARSFTLRRMRLTVQSGKSEGLAFTTDRDIVRLGSSPNNDVVLDDDTVSRSHAEIVRTRDGVLLRDLSSTNGSFVGPIRVREVFLPDEQSFRLGRTELSFQSEDEVVDIVPTVEDRLEGLVGQSVAMRAVFAVVERVAPTNLTVLVTGETGTGKELVSRSIHERSSRKDGPFEVFDCGAVAQSLVEAELFGHERGAYTGAHQSRAGVFERANGGTVFLDELGELPPPVQAALLRVLEQREVRRVGGQNVRPVDVRVVAATNRDLRDEVEAGRFREDLYYRLAVVELHLPPLRDRTEDLPLLIDHLLRGAEFPHTVSSASPAVLEAFEAWRWPGNVRELRNILLRSIPFTNGSSLGLEALPAALRLAGSEPDASSDDEGLALPGPDVPFHDAKERIMEAFEKHYLQTLMERSDGNLSRAARLAGVDRKTVARLLKRHEIR
ncbi:MAG: sigma 54-interacting transcriptional regulator [Myxococcota bacterium]